MQRKMYLLNKNEKVPICQNTVSVHMSIARINPGKFGRNVPNHSQYVYFLFKTRILAKNINGRNHMQI